MGLILFNEERYRSIRSSLVAYAEERDDFRTELWDALNTTAIDAPIFSPGKLEDKCTRFASGLWRANRVLVAARHSNDYYGTPALPDGGDVRSPASLVKAFDAVEYNVVSPTPPEDERFDLDGWGGHPNHAIRIFPAVYSAVVHMYSRTAPKRKRKVPR